MAQLRRDYEEIQKLQTEVLVVGPEGPQAFSAYWQENNLPFPGLPDPQYSVLKRYGQEINLFKLGRMPAQVLVDRQGVARFVHYGKSMLDIPEPAELMEIIAQLNAETEVQNA